MKFIKRFTTKTTEHAVNLLKPIINSILKKRLHGAFELEELSLHYLTREISVKVKPIDDDYHFLITLTAVQFLKIDSGYSLTFDELQCNHNWIEKLSRAYFERKGEGNAIALPKKFNVAVKTIKTLLPY